MMSVQPFQPRGANQTTPTAQVSGSVGTSVSQINLGTAATGLDGGITARFVVQGTDPVAWAYGNQSGLTLGNGCFMLPNSAETFALPPGVSQISAISSGTGSTLRIIFGDGI